MSDIAGRSYHLRGSAREIGFALGRALGEKLGQNIGRYIEKLPGSQGSLDTDKLRRGALPWLLSLPLRFQDELEGMAEGVNIPLRRLAEWGFVEQCVQNGCSGLVGLFEGRAWVARNNDTFVPDMRGYMTIREVDNRIPTISFGLEGDVFAPTGINREKLWLHLCAR